MSRYIEQINDSHKVPPSNCSINVEITCTPFEVKEALGKGKINLTRHASINQGNRDRNIISGCEHYSREGVQITRDDDDNIKDYNIPYTDPSQNIHFKLVAGLVKYVPKYINPISETFHNQGDTKLSEVSNELLHSVKNDEIALFPPNEIVIKKKPYNVLTACECLQNDCVYNLGKVNIQQLPLIKK